MNSPQQGPRAVYTVPEAAEILGVELSSVLIWIRAGWLRAEQRNQRLVVPYQEIETVLMSAMTPDRQIKRDQDDV